METTGLLLLRNAAIVDAAAPERRLGMHVLIEGDTIREVSDRPIAAPNVPAIDLAGRSLLPGFIDAHVHVIAVTTDLAGLARIPPYLVAAQADVVSPYRKTWAFLRRALPWTDIFHCNGDEAAALVGERDPARAAAALRRLGAGSVLVPLGGNGCVAAAADAVLRLPAFKVRVVDPTGAGDAFSAGIILKVYGALRRGVRDLSVAAWIRPQSYGLPAGVSRIFGNVLGSWTCGIRTTGLRFTTSGILDYDLPATIPLNAGHTSPSSST